MSEKNNVNPDHYKIGGRDRQGDDILQEVHKKQYAEAQAKGEAKESSLPASPRAESDSKGGDTNKSAERAK
jgi:hypothetical protein